MYSILKKALFTLNPELAHDVSMEFMGAAERLRLLRVFFSKQVKDPREVMGIQFPNAIGLAAGLDKNGDYFNALGELGFGFLEIGTITPVAQPGNPQPRLFRLVDESAIINRMGFNNKGVEYLVQNVESRRYKGVLGINIGKNKETPEEEALSDYLICLDAVYNVADYIAVNISSPNTPGLRHLQFGEALENLLDGIKARQAELAEKYGKYVPIAVKIAPDMSDDELKSVANTLVAKKIDAVIATNTTIDRAGVEYSNHVNEAGGLSGAPLMDKSTQVIEKLNEYLNGALPIIGVGGVSSGEDAVAKMKAGASLVQIYSGFIFEGPGLIKEAADAVKAYSA